MSNNSSSNDINWLGLEAPRYTSYPSAHHFTTRIGVDQHQQWLQAIETETSISVYIHIPFCKELCWFCGCHTKMTKRYTPIAQYVQVLLQEIYNLKQHIGNKGIIKNIHFGGGSPSLLQSADLMAILSALEDVFGKNAIEELAIELDPRTTPSKNIELYKKLGFTRVSIGIQDFDPIVQQAINRVQSFEMVKSIIHQFRAVDMPHINVDLIYGLPHQTAERFRDTLLKTIVLNPSRIALFSYAHIPHVKKHQRMIEIEWLPTEQDKLVLYVMACEMLVANGYVIIGIDHFAKVDDPLAVAMQNHSMKRNFQGYVTKTTDVLIGVGCSSISQFPQGYIQNSADVTLYRDHVEATQLPSQRGWQFAIDDIIRKRVIDEIMCFMTVYLAEICEEFGLDHNYFQTELKALQDEQFQEIYSIYENKISIKTPYRMAARVVAFVFDNYRNVAAGRFSKVA